MCEGEVIGTFDLASPGFHNALNATVAVAVAARLAESTVASVAKVHTCIESDTKHVIPRQQNKFKFDQIIGILYTLANLLLHA